MTALQQFVGDVEEVLSDSADEAQVLQGVMAAMRTLVARDDWLAAEFSQPHPKYYQQYLLHRDPAARFSVVSFVWGPGQATPIHDHSVWGVIGLLRGGEFSQPYAKGHRGMVPQGPEELLRPGDVAAVSPRIGDIHRVRNAHADQISISVHAYGADIGQVRRQMFDSETGVATEFVSGYSSSLPP